MSIAKKKQKLPSCEVQIQTSPKFKDSWSQILFQHNRRFGASCKFGLHKWLWY